MSKKVPIIDVDTKNFKLAKITSWRKTKSLKGNTVWLNTKDNRIILISKRRDQFMISAGYRVPMKEDTSSKHMKSSSIHFVSTEEQANKTARKLRKYWDIDD
jgi:hypothetical protein